MNTLKHYLMTSRFVLLSFILITSCIPANNKRENSQESQIKTNSNTNFFSSFSGFDVDSAKFKVGAETDTFHFKIKAITAAYLHKNTFFLRTIYILKHHSNDSIVIEASDLPLISHENFSRFYSDNKSKPYADTIVDPQIFDKFFLVKHDDIVNVESFQHLPFLFLDVNFNGYPALLVRENIGQDFYYYNVYGITDKGFSKVNFDPFLSIKSRINSWCY